MTGAKCPNCGDAMAAQVMAGAHANVEIDICYPCHAFWFDKMESPALSESAVLDLFKRIHEHKDQPRREIGKRLACPRCRAALAHTFDNQRGNKIEYERCPDGDGRFTTFFQFLREKHFVRSVTPVEMKELRANVSQVRCSGCGAVMSLEKSKCTHCGAAVSVLDADAVEKTLNTLSAAPPKAVQERPANRPPSAFAGKSLRKAKQKARRPWWNPEPGGGIHDLFDDSLGGLADWFDD